MQTKFFKDVSGYVVIDEGVIDRKTQAVSGSAVSDCRGSVCLPAVPVAEGLTGVDSQAGLSRYVPHPAKACLEPRGRK